MNKSIINKLFAKLVKGSGSFNSQPGAKSGETNGYQSRSQTNSSVQDSQQSSRDITTILCYAKNLASFIEKYISILQSGHCSALSSELKAELKELEKQQTELAPILLAYKTFKREKISEVIQYFTENIGIESPIKVKEFYIGKGTPPIEAAIIYVNNLANKEALDNSLLTPLMLYVDEDIKKVANTAEYISKTYISSSSTYIETDLQHAVDAVKNGNTVLILEKVFEFIIIDTTGGNTRTISEPTNEVSIRGPRNGFIEQLDINISLLRRILKDKHLAVEYFTVGQRSQSKLSLIYIKDIVDSNALSTLQKRIRAIDVDLLTATGMVEELLQRKYSLFPLAFSTERPDRVAANIIEGRIAIMLDGSPSVLTVPSLFWESFFTVEDYYHNSVLTSFMRPLRMLAALLVVYTPALYLTMVKFNSELIPVDFIAPIVSSRSGIPLTPFLEVFILEVLVEILREGGLRLPSKIAPTLSLVGGIIIGDAVISAKIVSPTTLLVIGITTVCSFVIPSYELVLTLRFLRFAMLIFANYMGIFGISAGTAFLLIHLFSLSSFGTAYFSLSRIDLEDIFIRAPLRQMRNTSAAAPEKKPIRQD